MARSSDGFGMSPLPTDELTVDYFRHKRKNVCRITLMARPSSANSLTESVMHQIQRAMDSATEKKCIVFLRAQSDCFCSGLDQCDLLRAILASNSCDCIVHRLLSLYEAILTYPGPTVAMVQGSAAGGGVGLAACFDVVLASPSARFEIPKGSYTPLAEVLIPLLNVRQQRFGWKKLSAWIGAKLDAAKACSYGLVNEIVEADKDLIEVALQQLDSLQPEKLNERTLKNLKAGMERARNEAATPALSLALGIGLAQHIVERLLRRTRR